MVGRLLAAVRIQTTSKGLRLRFSFVWAWQFQPLFCCIKLSFLMICYIIESRKLMPILPAFRSFRVQTGTSSTFKDRYLGALLALRLSRKYPFSLSFSLFFQTQVAPGFLLHPPFPALLGPGLKYSNDAPALKLSIQFTGNWPFSVSRDWQFHRQKPGECKKKIAGSSIKGFAAFFSRRDSLDAHQQ
ncbi:hypothetical protein BT69DRAFT_1305848, partial [Atractiella rhizophila]